MLYLSVGCNDCVSIDRQYDKARFCLHIERYSLYYIQKQIRKFMNNKHRSPTPKSSTNINRIIFKLQFIGIASAHLQNKLQCV